MVHELFEETAVIPLLTKAEEVQKLLEDADLPGLKNAEAVSKMIMDRIGSIGCKTALRLTERAICTSALGNDEGSAESIEAAQLVALREILDDFLTDEASAGNLCAVY